MFINGNWSFWIVVFFKEIYRKNFLNYRNRKYVQHYWSDKGFKGTVVNLCIEDYLKLSYTVPLIIIIKLYSPFNNNKSMIKKFSC